jgi:hypothetical protein
VQGLSKLMQLKQSMGGMMSGMSRMMGMSADEDMVEQVRGQRGWVGQLHATVYGTNTAMAFQISTELTWQR